MEVRQGVPSAPGIAAEHRLGGGGGGQQDRMEGPFDDLPFPNLHVLPLGVIPKKEPGKFRLIQHLSFPKGSLVNDGISKKCASVSYMSFNRVDLVRRAGPGAWLAKLDIEAFRLLLVHPSCSHLLGGKIEEGFYYDTCLPMGCTSSKCSFLE